MNGKELMLVMGGAIFLGGGAAIAGLMTAKPDAPANPAVDTAALDRRFEKLENSQLATQKSLERLSGTVDRLAQQIHAANQKAAEAAKAAEDLAAAGSGEGHGNGAPGRPSIRFPMGLDSLKDLTPEQKQAMEQAAKAKLEELKERMGDLGAGAHILSGEDLPEGLRDVLSSLETEILGAEGMNEGLAGAASGMLKGLQLRRLPEDERWAKAQEDLNLTGYQADELKAATKDLDEDMKNAMLTEHRETPDGGKITIKRHDPAKLTAARKRYDERVDNALDTDQRKKWRDDGYANAFGRSPAGAGISVISTSTIEMGSGGGDK